MPESLFLFSSSIIPYIGNRESIVLFVQMDLR